MTAADSSRFGPLELANGELWLGAPRRRFRSGIRLGPDQLSQWGAPGPRDVAWEAVKDLAVLIGEPEERGRVARAVDRVDRTFDWISLSTGMSARWYDESDGGVRLDWRSGISGERSWAAARVNWPAPLSDVELHGATRFPVALQRSTSLREKLRAPARIGELLGELRAAVTRGDVDRVLERAS